MISQSNFSYWKLILPSPIFQYIYPNLNNKKNGIYLSTTGSSLFCWGPCMSYITMTSVCSIICFWSQDKILRIHSFSEQQNITWQRNPGHSASFTLCVPNFLRQKYLHNTHTYIIHICLWTHVYEHIQLTLKSDYNVSNTVLITLHVFIPLTFRKVATMRINPTIYK